MAERQPTSERAPVTKEEDNDRRKEKFDRLMHGDEKSESRGTGVHEDRDTPDSRTNEDEDAH